jgi:hypothetical protein
MAFDYRFHYTSYNSLIVPLDIGTWECKLLLNHEYRERKWRRDSDGKGEEDARQLEKDIRAFDLYFRPNYDVHSVTGQAALREIQAFLGHHLNVAHSNLPTDNAGIERVLRQAVSDGTLMPVVNRDYPAPPRTFRPAPAPLDWQPAGGGGTNWLGVTEAIASTALGSNDASSHDVSTDSDAQPFEYSENSPADGVQDLAARGVSEADEADCFAQYQRDMAECHAYRMAMGGARFMDACSQRAFMKYQQCRGY